jgi:ATP-dependent DNA helicase RecG
VLTVDIPANSGQLYQYDGACYVRRGTNTVPLSVEAIGAYLNAYGASRWELTLARNTTIDDIAVDAVERYLGYRAETSRQRRRHSSVNQLLLGLDAIARDPQTGVDRPTNARMLMFGYDPQLYLPQSEVVCIKYADPPGVRRYIDRKNVHGTLPELIDQASRFLRQYIRVGATIRGFYREDEPEYPYEALREAVVNAVVHRDYSRIGETVRVFMFPDRVEVRSPGGLLPGITLADLVAMRVTSNPRNAVLAGFLRDIPGYMERVGSGIRFMINEMREMGLPDPEFSEHFDFMVVFRNGVVAAETPDIHPRQQIGLQIVREQGSISTSEYTAATGAPVRTAYRDLQDLVERGLLVVRGKRRGARYYLA